MRRPRRLRIGPFTYRVVKDKYLGAVTSNNGVCGTDVERIHLAVGMSKGMERDTLLHEALHACWTQTGLDSKYSHDEEEDAIWQLAPRLLALLRDNPELVDWLTEP